MFLIEKKNIKGWQHNSNGRFTPVSFSTHCPYCNALVILNIHNIYYYPNGNTFSGIANCPGCSNTVNFLIVNPSYEREECEAILIYPEIQEKRKTLEGIEFLPEERLIRAYNTALSSFNNRDWNSTAVQAGRTLEGITKTNLPEEHREKVLYKQLELLPNYLDLKRPILELANAIREGRNLGAHFDLEKDTDEETATELIDLLEYLIDYIYILPQKIENLQQRIKSSEKKDTTENGSKEK